MGYLRHRGGSQGELIQFPSTHACLLVQGICQSWHSHCLSIKCNSFKARDTLCLANSRWLCAASFINFAACFDPALLCAVFCFLTLRVSLVLFFLYLYSTFSLFCFILCCCSRLAGDEIAHFQPCLTAVPARYCSLLLPLDSCCLLCCCVHCNRHFNAL